MRHGRRENRRVCAALAVLAKSCQKVQTGAMVTMNISLPDDMKAFVDAEVRRRGFASSSEYVRALIREQKEVDALRSRLQASTPTPIGAFDQDYFAQLRSRVDRQG